MSHVHEESSPHKAYLFFRPPVEVILLTCITTDPDFDFLRCMAKLFTFVLVLIFVALSLPSAFGCDKLGGGCAKRRRNPKSKDGTLKGRRLLSVNEYVGPLVLQGLHSME
eukprot:TRINITY_DN55_c0_g2_i1.p1 TRINITY_DN55_c0_g2~~TRINITY_DN55_c0_g2_i1.p1  ORF type:complete len:110 (+),score=11.03 TRINITY_DN55_c0_g2_i1:15-344(+)